MSKEIISHLKKYAIEHNIPVMLDGSLKVLLGVILEIKPKNVLEIGTAIGYSALNMLESYGDIDKLVTIELNEDRYNIAKDSIKKAGYIDKVNLMLGDCNEIIGYLEGKYDLIVLDGPKGQYYDMLTELDRLLDCGGIIFADNTDFKGKTAQIGKIEHKHRTIVKSLLSFKNELLRNKSYEVKSLSIADGIIIAKKVL